MNQLDDRSRPDAGGMRYFTPDLLLQLNSHVAEEVERSMRDWERAFAEYRKALRGVGRELPPQSRRLLELSLHDWKLVKIEPACARPGSRSPATLIMVLEYRNHLTILSYALTQKLRRLKPSEKWSRSGNDNVYWLYDEVDFGVTERPSFVHRILFSDGSTLIVPFSTCNVAQAELDHSMSHSDLKRIA